MYNVVLVSGVQQHDLGVCVCVCARFFFFQIHFHYG